MSSSVLPVQQPTFAEAFRFWLKLGFISFGGPAGQIAIMHTFLVEEKRWISESRFLHALNYCMLLPGPEAQQLATYVGWLLHGVRGGLVAGILFVLPSVFILLGLSLAYVTYGTIPWVYALFQGLKPAVVAIVLLALVKISGKSLLSPAHYAVALGSFVGIFFFNIPFPLIILGALLLAALGGRWLTAGAGKGKDGAKQVADESSYYLRTGTRLPHTVFQPGKLLRQVGIGLALWGLPLVLFYAFSPHFAFWRTLTLFFTQAALVTFGGAYAVLPYVSQVAVEKFGWLSSGQMLDGLALGESTPGPLIMVLVFVGFMAGYHQAGGSLLAGTLGLLTTTFYTFLPCFLFILAGAPLVERTQHNPRIKAMLSVVTAAVVGVVLNLTVYLGKAVILPAGWSWAQLQWIDLAWVLLSLVALYRFKLNMILWIGISAVFGLLCYVLRIG